MKFKKFKTEFKIIELFIVIIIFSLITFIILLFKLHGFFDSPSYNFEVGKHYPTLIDTPSNDEIFEDSTNDNSIKNEETEDIKDTQKIVKRDKRLGRLFGGESHLNVYDIHSKLPQKVLYKIDDTVREDKLKDTDCLPLTLPKPLFLHTNPLSSQHLTPPSFPPISICVHPMDIDTYISFQLQRDGIWEGTMVGRFIGLLLSNPDLLIYDVGANIGVYSMIAAALGHMVVAVEPVMSNVVRIHQAVVLNKLQDKVTLVQNAILNRRTTLEMDVPSDNQGGGKLSNMDADRYCDDVFTCPTHAQTVLLNDLLDVSNGRRGLIKIDVEGAEHRAMRVSRMLFREVEIAYVMMEWREVRKYHGSFENQSEDKQLVAEMIAMMLKRGYVVECVVTGKPLSVQHWYGWPDNVLWVLVK